MPKSLLRSEIAFESVTVDERGAVVARTPHRATLLSERLAEGVTLDLVALPATEGWVGALPGEGFDDERPRHRVTLAPFALGRAPVTQAQWAAVMGRLPPVRDVGSDLPVHRVTWHDARRFCDRLSRRTGRAYRLPAEAEWEVACRGGTTSPFYTGPTLTTDLANYVGLHTYAREPEGVYRHHTTPADLFPPNPFGLQDMHGNVWEWCADAWHGTYVGAPSDGSPWEAARPAGHGGRVLRGGCWHDPPNLCRSAARLRSEPNEPEDYFGFRVALTPDTGTPS